MDYIIENDYLKVTVTTKGAQIKSVIRKCDGVEHIWQADPNVWGWYGPILFPYAGRLSQGKLEAKGKVYEGAPHGFARKMEHDFVAQTEDTIVLELSSNEETLALFPYEFRLVSTFTLEGDTLHHSLTVEDLDEEPLSFGIGYHPAFALPFDEKHTYQDYELRFSQMESPLCLSTQPTGLIQTQHYSLGNNITAIPIDEKLFADDSHCMIGLQSETLGLYETGTGRGVVCHISGFPYVLLWSMPGKPHFVCIEPWMSLPSFEGSSIKWEDKPAAAILSPGESWSTTLSMTFTR